MSCQTLVSIVSSITTQQNFKIVILLAFTWIVVTIFHTIDVGDPYISPPPMYYYTSLNDDKIRKRQKMDHMDIDISFLEEFDGNTYDNDHGNVPNMTAEATFVLPSFHNCTSIYNSYKNRIKVTLNANYT